MPTGSLIPIWRWLITNNGVFSPGAKLYTYESGGSTPLPTYQTAALTGGAAHANPVVADAEGVLPVIYLLPQAYRMEVQDSTGAVIFAAQDNIYDFGQFAAATGITATILGTYGTTLTAGQSAYLSDGSGALTAGRWYLTDADLTYASTLPAIVGIVLATGTVGQTGLIAVSGRVTNQSGLAAGSTYYASATAGALTSSAPTNARIIGAADSTTSLVLSGSQPTSAVAIDDIGLSEGRLTLTTGVAVTVTDVTAAGTIYFTPYRGNRVALYDGSMWALFTFTERSLALTATVDKNYDVFLYSNAGTLTLELSAAWASDTSRTDALVLQDGIYVKSGATTRRYLGTIRASGANVTEDSYAKRFVWNTANRVSRPMRVLEATNSWTYTLATWRQANAAAGNQLGIVVGLSEEAIDVAVLVTAVNSGGGTNYAAAIGEDSTTTVATGGTRTSGTAAVAQQLTAQLRTIPAIGYHFYTWLESSEAVNTTTWNGDGGTQYPQSGITAMHRA